MKAYGGRFLSRGNDDAFWYELPDNKARTKASQGKLFMSNLDDPVAVMSLMTIPTLKLFVSHSAT